MATGEDETGPFRRGIASVPPAPHLLPVTEKALAEASAWQAETDALWARTPAGHPPTHPARYSQSILPILRAWTEGCERVLDPLAGIGTGGIATHYNELEPEWAAQCEGMVTVGDAAKLPYASDSFDGIVTSPVYGNRMSDHHDAQDSSTRVTYRHKLGRPLHPANAGQLQWGSRYRNLHIDIWHEVWRVLKPGGRFILNIADHIRAGERAYVSTWHLYICQQIGFRYVKGRTVDTPGMRYGENGKKRVGYEYVYYFEKGV